MAARLGSLNRGTATAITPHQSQPTGPENLNSSVPNSPVAALQISHLHRHVSGYGTAVFLNHILKIKLYGRFCFQKSFNATSLALSPPSAAGPPALNEPLWTGSCPTTRTTASPSPCAAPRPESKPIPYVYSYTDSAGQAMFQPLATEPNPLQFDASGDRQFVRLRYVDGPLDPIHGDHDRDGVSNQDEVSGAQTDPFAYPDEDLADSEPDGLPDAWERYRFGTLDHAGADVHPAGQTYASLYAVEKRDTDGDDLPDDWEKFRCGGTLAEHAGTIHDGKSNLARFREDRVKLAEHRYGAQVFRYDPGFIGNAFDTDPANPLRVHLRGNQGGSMIVMYSNTTYANIISARIWPSNGAYGFVRPDVVDPAKHYADYTGTVVNDAYDYTFSATPTTGDYVARDLLRSLDGRPLARSVVSGVAHRNLAPLAITSLPPTNLAPGSYPIILRDFPYASPVFPEFGGNQHRITNGIPQTLVVPDLAIVSTLLDGGPLLGVPRLSTAFFALYPSDSGLRFASWFTHPDALSCTLSSALLSSESGFWQTETFFPHANEVGSPQGEPRNQHAFTVEAHLRLDYDLAETWIHFASDDDMWVYIDGRLVLAHDGRQSTRTTEGLDMSLATLREKVKDRDGAEAPFLDSATGSCRVDIFFAERETPNSSLGFKSNGGLHPVYAYQAVTDADLPTSLSFSLTQAPPGMNIDARTGRVLWDYVAQNRDANPDNDIAASNYPVTILVTDSRGYSATQSFTIHVQLPSAP